MSYKLRETNDGRALAESGVKLGSVMLAAAKSVPTRSAWADVPSFVRTENSA
jgi:hypothetical protein